MDTEMAPHPAQVTTPRAAAAPAYVPTTGMDFTTYSMSTPKNPHATEKDVYRITIEPTNDATNETKNHAFEGAGVQFLLFVVNLLLACVCAYGYPIILSALRQLQINTYFQWFIEEILLPALVIEAVVVCLFGRIIFYHLLSAAVDSAVVFMLGYLAVVTALALHVLSISFSQRMFLEKILGGALAIGGCLGWIFGRIILYHLFSRVMYLIFGAIFVCWFVTILRPLCQFEINI